MVRISYPHSDRTIEYLLQRLDEDKGCSLVYTPTSLLFNLGHIHAINDTSRPKRSHSIVICTYGRPDSLNVTLKSLAQQTYKDFEIILITEKGDLASLRQLGLSSSIGSTVSFIDDDVYCEPTWLESVTQTFKEDTRIVGVTGPTTITDEYRNNRDLFKYKLWKRIYDILFLGQLSSIPSHISSCGTPSTASNDHELSYDGRCDFLEACNMSVRRKEALDAGGFDTVYYRTSEWCEVDLALKLGQRGRLYFSRLCKLYHRPSRAGIYSGRLKTQHRWENFMHFQRRWVRPSVRAYLYRGFIWTYLKVKGMRLI